MTIIAATQNRLPDAQKLATTRGIPYPAVYSEEQISYDHWNHTFLKSANKGLTIRPVDQPPQNVLDIGCGSGIWVIDAARQWPEAKVIGLDILKIQPKLSCPGIAEQYSDIAGRVQFVHTSFLDPLPFSSESFDFVRVCNIGLGVPEDSWNDLFQEISRILTRNGTFELLEEDLLFPHADPSPTHFWSPERNNSQPTSSLRALHSFPTPAGRGASPSTSPSRSMRGPRVSNASRITIHSLPIPPQVPEQDDFVQPPLPTPPVQQQSSQLQRVQSRTLRASTSLTSENFINGGDPSTRRHSRSRSRSPDFATSYDATTSLPSLPPAIGQPLSRSVSNFSSHNQAINTGVRARLDSQLSQDSQGSHPDFYAGPAYGSSQEPTRPVQPHTYFHPQDHTKLSQAHSRMLARRFLACGLLSVLSFYVDAAFGEDGEIWSGDVLGITLPPNSRKKPVGEKSEGSGRERFGSSASASARKQARTEDDGLAEIAQRTICTNLKSGCKFSMASVGEGNMSGSQNEIVRTDAWDSMHLARAVSMSVGCKKAIWEEYLRTELALKPPSESTSPATPFNGVRESPSLTPQTSFMHSNKLNPSSNPDRDRIQNTRYEFDVAWSNWEQDMQDRIAMRACLGQLVQWTTSRGVEPPEWKKWRDRVGYDELVEKQAGGEQDREQDICGKRAEEVGGLDGNTSKGRENGVLTREASQGSTANEAEESYFEERGEGRECGVEVNSPPLCRAIKGFVVRKTRVTGLEPTF